MEPYERLEKAYEAFYIQLDKAWELLDQIAPARDKGDYFTCYKLLDKSRAVSKEAIKKLEKDKEKISRVSVAI